MKLKRKQFALIGLWMALVLMVSLACGLGGALEAVNQAQEAAGTIQVLATNADDVVQQFEDMATEVSESGLAETANAALTQAVESGLQETMMAAATQAATVIAGAQPTLEAAATQMGEAPEDIPIVEGEVESLLATANLISYQTTMPFDEVVAFYETQMLAQGWAPAEGQNVTQGQTTIATYAKDTRHAVLTITGEASAGKTAVLIVITP